jgi:hypothetical protein
MRTVLGIDPGATIGWCLYSSDGTVIRHGEVDAETAAGTSALVGLVGRHSGPIAIERPRVYSSRNKDGVIAHASGNDVADTCEQAGWLVAICGGAVASGRDMGRGAWHRGNRCYLLERRAVTWAVRRHFGEPIVGDGPIWKALLAAHGGNTAMLGPKQGKPATRTKAEEIARAPGHLHGMGGHARAAFATAWALSQLLDEMIVNRKEA